MPIEVLMPALSPTMTEGNLAKWHKKVGDSVKAGDVIAEIETDKATMEVEAVDEGLACGAGACAGSAQTARARGTPSHRTRRASTRAPSRRQASTGACCACRERRRPRLRE